MTQETRLTHALGRGLVQGVTPKLYRIAHPDTPNMVVWSLNGKRTRKYFADREKAEEYFRKIAAQAEVEGLAGLVMDAPARAEYFEAKRRLGAVPLRVAVEAYLRNHPAAGTDRPTADALEGFLRACRLRNLAPKTLENLGGRVTAFLAHEMITNTRELDTQHVRAYLERDGVAARTRVNDRAALQRWCRWMVRERMIGADPVAETDRPVVDYRAPSILSAAQAEALMRAAETQADGCMVVFYALALFAGLRPGEIARLRWDQVRLDGREPMLRIEAGKKRGGRAVRVVPLAGNLVAWLKGRTASPMMPARPRWPSIEVRRAAGLVKEHHGRVQGWQADVCRHSWISYRLALVHDEARVAREAGNSPSVIFAHYHRAATRAEAAQFFAIAPNR